MKTNKRTKNKKVRIILLILILILVIISIFLFNINKSKSEKKYIYATYNNYLTEEEITEKSITFTDEKLYQKICEELIDIIQTKDDNTYTITVLSSDIKNLKSLSLNNSNISAISGIEAFVYLEELNISNNNITDISIISNLTNLTNLQAYGNTISDISPISNLTNLKVLNISKNKLDDSSSNSDSAVTLLLSNLTNLTNLDISHNYLSYTNGLETLTNLTTLNLYDNAIHDLSGLSTLVNLETLKLGENNENGSGNIENLDVLNNLKNLKYLDFSENLTSTILENITNLTKLETLNIEENGLTDISEISNFTNLKVVNLYNNSISDISPLFSLTNLEEIVLQKNEITSLDGILDNNDNLIWTNLTKLDIYLNDINDEEILEILCKMSNNKTLELNYENITDTSQLPHYDKDGTAYVTYEDFGARCDGVYDDFIAIRNAHIYANTYGYEVRATEGKTYHIFKYYEDAVTVSTNVDWNNANFIIHDEEIEEVSGRYKQLFKVTNITKSVTISNPTWTIGTDTTNIYDNVSSKLKTLNESGYTTYLCVAKNSNKKQYIRYGSNANSGDDQQDYFLIDSNGNVLNDIQWDFEQLTSFTIYAIPNTEINIENGNFTSNSVISQSETTYTRLNSGKSIYFTRNIYVNKSANVNISNINHTLSSDEMSGSYRGFIYANLCANINISDCELYTRKYSISGRSTYDLNIYGCVNVYCNNITSNDIFDAYRWGIVATYFSKDVTFENCVLNRIDAHQGIYNLTVSNCEIGIKGLTLTGQGDLNVLNTTITSESFITLRTDYGSTWNGNAKIVDCTFIYDGTYAPKLFTFKTSIDDNGTVHDFGYDCKFPNVYVENITIDLVNCTNYNCLYIVPNYASQNSAYTLDSYWPDEIYVNGYNFINASSSNPYIRMFGSSVNIDKMVGNYVITDTTLNLLDTNGTNITSKFDFNEQVITNENVYLKISENNSAVNAVSLYKDNETLVENIPIEDSYSYTFEDDGTYTIKIYSTENIYSKTGTKTYEFVIDKTDPIIEINEISKEWTNEDVIVTMNIKDNETGINTVTINGEVITQIGGVYTYTVSENGTYEVVVVDNSGNETTSQFTIANIDKEAPVITGAVDGETYIDKISINATDSLSGIKKVILTKDDTEIAYTLGEEINKSGVYKITVEDNASNSTVITFTLNISLDITGSITWDDNDNQDGKRPSIITIHLYANETEVDSKEVTASDNWEYSFTNLDKYSDKATITYTIIEDMIEDYTTTYTGYNITNSYTPSKIGITVAKVWNDNDNQDGIRPDSVTISLIKNNEVTNNTIILSEENNWQETFTNLDEYENETKITYTVKENEVTGYEYEITGSVESGYILTNTHEVQKIEVAGTISWDDSDNQDETRPSSITIRLYADGIEVNSKAVTASDNWEYVFSNLDKYSNSNEIIYTIIEDNIDGYTNTINGYDITNIHTIVASDEPTTDDTSNINTVSNNTTSNNINDNTTASESLPNTGKKYVGFFLAILCIAGIGFFIKYKSYDDIK